MEWDKEKIKALRNKLELTQPQLAELLGTSQVVISYWETGRGNPSSISQNFLSLIAEKISVEEIKEKKQKEQKYNKDTIKAFREKLGLNKTQFASLLSLDTSTVSYWESGEKNPSKTSQKALKSLAEKKGVDLEYLAEGLLSRHRGVRKE
jgi:DNA-binding transcriptional regulator YiaG